MSLRLISSEKKQPFDWMPYKNGVLETQPEFLMINSFTHVPKMTDTWQALKEQSEKHGLNEVMMKDIISDLQGLHPLYKQPEIRVPCGGDGGSIKSLLPNNVYDSMCKIVEEWNGWPATEYEHLLLQALLVASGAKVKYESHPDQHGALPFFVRDPLVVVPEAGMVIQPMQEEKKQGRQRKLPEERAHLLTNIPSFDNGAFQKSQANGVLEGGNIQYDQKLDIFLQGHSFFDNGETRNGGPEADKALGEATGKEVISVPHIMPVSDIGKAQRMADTKKELPPAFDPFHLDYYLSVLPKGEVLVAEAAVSPETIRMLEGRFGKENIIRADFKTYAHKGLNLVNVGNTLVSPFIEEKLAKILTEKGYNVVAPNLMSDIAKNNPDFSASVLKELENNGVIKWLDDMRVLEKPTASTLGVNPFTGKPATLTHRDGGPHCMTLPINRHNHYYKKAPEYSPAPDSGMTITTRYGKENGGLGA